MIDCDRCSKSIGNLTEPIFVDSAENTVCRECFTKSEGHSPNEEDAQFDPDDVCPEDLK